MELGPINTRLTSLAKNYSHASAAGNSLLSTIARTTVITLPAVAAFQQLGRVLGHQSFGGLREVEAGLRKQTEALQAAQQKGPDLTRQHKAQLEKNRADGDSMRAQLPLLKLQQSIAKSRGVAISLEQKQLEDAAKVRLLTEKELLRQKELLVERNKVLFAEASGRQKILEANQQLSQNRREHLTMTLSTHKREVAAASAELTQQREELERTVKEIRSLPRTLAVGTGIAINNAALTATIAGSASLNRSLIAANVAVAERERLWKGVLKVQGQTGDSLENLTELAGVLRSQAQLYRKDWTDVLATASKLQQGLGATSGEIAEMLNATRALRLSFRDLADSVTNVVDKTSLSVRETIGLVTELRRVLTGFNVRAVGGTLEGPLRHLAALEEAMKARGATEGGALRALKGFTSMQQLGGLGLAFNSGGVDFLRDPARSAQLQRNLANFLEQFRNVPLVFEQIASSMGMAADDAQIFIDAVKNRGQVEQQLSQNQINLQKRFTEQSAQSLKTWSQLGQAIKALALEALTPLIPVVQSLSRLAGDLRDHLVALKAAMPSFAKDMIKAVAPWAAASVMLGGLAAAAWKFGAGVMAVARMTSKALAVIRGGTAAAAAASAASTGARVLSGAAAARAANAAAAPWTVAGARAAGTAVTPLAAGGAAGLLKGLVPLMTAVVPFILPAIMAGVAAYAWYKVFAQWRAGQQEDERTKRMVQEIYAGKAQSYQKVDTLLRDQLRQGSGVAAAKGLQEELSKRKNQMLIDAARGDPHALEMMKELREFTRARVTAQEATASLAKGRVESARLNEIRLGNDELLKALAVIEGTMKELATAAQKGAATRQQQEKKEEERVREQQRVEKTAADAAAVWAGGPLSQEPNWLGR